LCITLLRMFRRPGSNYFKDQPKNVFLKLRLQDKRSADPDDVPSDWLVGYAPGQPLTFSNRGKQNLFRPAQISFWKFTTCRKQRTTDQAMVGLVFAKEPPKNES